MDPISGKQLEYHRRRADYHQRKADKVLENYARAAQEVKPKRMPKKPLPAQNVCHLGRNTEFPRTIGSGNLPGQ